ncbi:carbon-nitrogen hydrolase family protein [Rhodoferax sp.]|uniref:carbon-nitrogen hydrolase family protein n=1 Tax=Rhodoferax sp. TaxID=50421 RepID=UPI0025FFE048|nr:carbon-nitrogen hydrolase family protein [Rhodoferax sp.]
MIDLPNDLRLALLQCPSLPLDVPANLARLDAFAAQAAAAGAHLLVTPEMFLTGYNIGGPAAAVLAERPDGPRAQAVAAIARQHQIAIAFGHPEHDDVGAIFNAAQCIDAQGQMLARYRKTHLFGDLDRGMFSPGPGDEPLFSFHGWQLGLLICFDVEFPENTRRLALQGADLIVVPTANMEGFDFVAQHLVPTRAYENQLFVAYANFCGSEGDLVYNGLSCVAAPNGTGLVQAGRGAELLLADVTRAGLAAGRALNGHLALCRTPPQKL